MSQQSELDDEEQMSTVNYRDLSPEQQKKINDTFYDRDTELDEILDPYSGEKYGKAISQSDINDIKQQIEALLNKRIEFVIGEDEHWTWEELNNSRTDKIIRNKLRELQRKRLEVKP